MSRTSRGRDSSATYYSNHSDSPLLIPPRHRMMLQLAVFDLLKRDAIPMTDAGLVDLLLKAERILRARTVDEVVTRFSACIEAFGYGTCLITRLPAPDVGNWQTYILANRWPGEWFERYNSAGHYRHDPCVAQCRRTTEPFLWHDIDSANYDKLAEIVMGEASEFGLRQGICIPLHAPFLPPITVTAAGDEVDTSPIARQSVSILSRSALSATMRFGARPAQEAEAGLSHREAEILKWAAAGKTAWEISVILSVSQHTVLTHVRNAKQKLAATNIVHAVVEGLRRHEIEL
ncbi:MAG: LuxR family transcriptional regulator [Rhizobiaceae bacterium]|nr:MAG: LuxR family transcriptional regulator [Rhizobiaceae bacterium]